MLRSSLPIFGVAMLALAAGCASSNHHGRAVAVTPATADQRARLLDRVASLEGTWELTDPEGKTQTAAVFTVTSNKSAVREIMFPGSPHEMTNFYHMDGPDLVVTHYCAQGNQPHMRARAAANPAGSDRIAFEFDGLTNMTSPDQMYMGELTLVFVDADHVVQEWKSFKRGVADTNHSPNFELTRKR